MTISSVMQVCVCISSADFSPVLLEVPAEPLCLLPDPHSRVPRGRTPALHLSLLVSTCSRDDFRMGLVSKDEEDES